jgi:hypothetical protein
MTRFGKRFTGFFLLPGDFDFAVSDKLGNAADNITFDALSGQFFKFVFAARFYGCAFAVNKRAAFLLSKSLQRVEFTPCYFNFSAKYR